MNEPALASAYRPEPDTYAEIGGRKLLLCQVSYFRWYK